jgi:hypothetical protein
MSIKSGVRYVIVDKETEALDWDAELHESFDAAVASMCGPRHMFVRTEAEVDDEHELWSNVYEIRRVLPARATRSS